MGNAAVASAAATKPPRKKTGPKPATELEWEREWANRAQQRITLQCCPVDVYIERQPLKLHVRGTRLYRKQKRVPDGAVHVGRYDQPFDTRAFLDDVAATLAEANT